MEQAAISWEVEKRRAREVGGLDENHCLIRGDGVDSSFPKSSLANSWVTQNLYFKGRVADLCLVRPAEPAAACLRPLGEATGKLLKLVGAAGWGVFPCPQPKPDDPSEVTQLGLTRQQTRTEDLQETRCGTGRAGRT